MRPLLRLFALAIPSLVVFAACSDDADVIAPDGSTPALDAEVPDAPVEQPDASAGASSSGAPQETCTARFVWLQKDAYKETGGRSSALWPPHTTTTLAVDCGGETVASAFHANHGSEPESRDDSGRLFLDEVKRSEVQGTRAELLALLETYEGCECEAGSFLSMNSLSTDVVQDLLEEFTLLVEDTIECADGGTALLVEALRAQDFETALTLVPTCSWPEGDVAPTLTEALQSVLQGAQRTLESYHVCNNDAKLQADLFASFGGASPLAACNQNSDTCKGPMWFYDPDEAP